MRNSSFRMLSILCTAAIALFASACSSSTGSQPPVAVQNQVTIQVDNSMQFGTPSLSVESGQPVTLTLQNVGDSTHDFTLTNGVAAPVKFEAGPGQSAQGTFVIQAPGTYEFVCSQPTHALLGMRGTILAR
jgi:plastocyanin